jgi:hypothetical protein
MMVDRSKKVEEIVEFVGMHKESLASKSICARILGDKNVVVGAETINELRLRLPNAEADELDACYYLVK